MRGYLFFLTVFGFGCRAAVVAKINAIPTADITSHEDGDTAREGFAEILQGQVADSDHSNEELEIAWVVGGIDVCPDSAPDKDGLVECEAIFGLGEGSGLVSLTVSDGHWQQGWDQVTLDVQANNAPMANIQEPTADGIYYSDNHTNLWGTVSDTEDAADTLTVQWHSSVDGVLYGNFSIPNSEGGLEGAAILSEGEHTITLTATDSIGKETRENVTIHIGSENIAPTCAIIAPESGSAGVEGAEVTFAATATDVDVPAEWLSVSWESDIDGALGDSTPDSAGEVSFPIDSLTINTHTITMTVADEHGLSCATNVTYTVGTLPMLTVTAPTDGAILNHSEEVVFEATVDDNEDSPNEVTLSWESDVDGIFSDAGADEEGAVSLSVGTLSPGDQMVTVTATDTHGLMATETIGFHLNQPPTTPTVTLGPDPAYTTDTLTAVASGSEDPDASGDVTYQYAWYEDGVLSEASTSDTFPADSTAKNRTYRVVVTPTDGMFDGTSAEAEVAVLNTAPVLSTVSIAPDPAYNDDTLVCSATATDADDDDATITYEWTGGATGSELPLTSIIAASGDSLACTATADDGDGGADSASASVTIGNRAPTVTASIEPSAPTKNSTLTCSASDIADPDDDATTLSFTWTVAETPTSASSTPGTTSTLEAAFVAGQTVACSIEINDGKGGSDTSTASVEILNSPPEVTEVTLSPASVYTNDTVTADATTSDDDGDALTVTYAFSVDGEVVQDGSSNTLDGSVHFDKGQTITVAVTADDATETDSLTSDFVTVLNTAPTEPGVAIEQGCDEGWTEMPDGIRCARAFDTSTDWRGSQANCESYGGNLVRIDDAEDNAFVIDLYAATDAGSIWFHAGMTDEAEEGAWVWLDGTASSYRNWDSGQPDLESEDCLEVVASGWGNTTCEDTSYTGHVCQISQGTGLTCTIDEASTDIDDDALSYIFEWDVDGISIEDTETSVIDGDTIPSSLLGDDEIWTCTATPNDGEDNGSSGTASYEIEPPECCAFTFDDSSADMSVSTSGFGLGQSDFTVEFWMHAADTASSNGIIFRTKEENYQAMQITANLSESGIIKLDAVLFETPSTCVEPNNGWDISLPHDDDWHHIVFQRRGDNIESYLDGEFQLSADMVWYGCGCGSSRTPCLSESSPGGFGFGTAPEGVSIGAFRFVRNAQYSTTFSPATNWTVDGDTLAQWNTDSCFDGTTLPDSSTRENDGYDPSEISEGYATCAEDLSETSDATYAWTNVGSDTVGMIYGSCGSSATSTATCNSSTAGEFIYINDSGGGSLERKRIGETHLGLTGARGSSISISSDGTEASWQGATGCGGDRVEMDTVDIYQCISG